MFGQHTWNHASLNRTQTDLRDAGERVIVPGIYSLLFRNCQTTTKALVNAIVPIEDRVENFAFPWDATTALQTVIWGSLAVAVVYGGGYAIWYSLMNSASAVEVLEAMATIVPDLTEFISSLATEWGPQTVKMLETVGHDPDFQQVVVQGLGTIYELIRHMVVQGAIAGTLYGYNVAQTNMRQSAEGFLQRIVQWLDDKARRAHASCVPM